MAKRSGSIAIFNSQRYEFWLTLVMVLVLVNVLFIPIPGSEFIGALVGIGILVYAKNNHIKEDFGLDDLLYAGVLLGALIFIVGALALSTFAKMSLLEILVLGLVLDAIGTATGMVPIIGDFIGAVLAFFVVFLLFGPSALLIAGFVAFLLLLPGPLPLATISLVGLKILLEVLF